MPLKTSTITLCCPPSTTYHHLPSLTSPLRPCPYPPHHHQQQRQQSQPRQQQQCHRRYATHSRHPDEPTNPSRTPDWPRSSSPTPYEIFDIARSAPYTKHRFYQLVKLYHPDKHHPTSPTASSAASKPPSSPSPDLAPATRLERYRLVVAANDLLSSPSKRRLYDTHGLGWLPNSPSQHSHSDLRRADRAWRTSPNSAAHNATWEDWERWHQAQSAAAHGAANHTRAPLYMSHRMFASLVVLLCFVGALAQKSRAESIGDEYVEWKARRHAEIGRDLSKRGMETAGMGRDERVHAFVRDRENAGYQFSPAKYDSIPNRWEGADGEKDT